MRIPRTLACTRLLAVLPLALLLLAGCADHELPTAPPPATPSFAAIQVGCNTADLISAIAAANTNPGSDLIELEAGCTYTFTAGIASAVGPNALPRITSEITIIGNGATIQRSSDEQTPEFRILAVAASASLELSDLTIKGGRSTANGGGLHIRGLAATENVTFSGNSAVGLGGAIASADGTVTIRNSTFVDNVSGTSGGAIANWPNTALEVERTTFFRNGAGEDGGAMWNGGTLQITDATFGRNSAVGLGGAISSVEGVATITNSTFSNNSTAVRGGAIANYPGATLNITGGSFSDNSSATSGGGIRNGGTLSILQSTFAGNRADADGGAISTSGPTTIISKTTFAGNHTDALGGGISNTSGIATITNSTFSGNSTATRGGGIANYPGATLVLTHSTLIGNTAVTVGAGIRNGGTLTLRNNLIAGNNASSEVDLSSVGTTAAYNLIGSPGGHAIADGVDHNIVGVAGADLNLGALAANGGLTWTHALLAGSPAIDAGTCTDHNGDPVTTDQRGVIRPQPAGGACDIGAFEAPPACEKLISGYVQRPSARPSHRLI